MLLESSTSELKFAGILLCRYKQCCEAIRLKRGTSNIGPPQHGLSLLLSLIFTTSPLSAGNFLPDVNCIMLLCGVPSCPVVKFILALVKKKFETIKRPGPRAPDKTPSLKLLKSTKIDLRSSGRVTWTQERTTHPNTRKKLKIPPNRLFQREDSQLNLSRSPELAPRQPNSLLRGFASHSGLITNFRTCLSGISTSNRSSNGMSDGLREFMTRCDLVRRSFR